MGRISPHLVVQDAVVPRTRLPDVLAEIARDRAAHSACRCATSSTPATATCIRISGTTRTIPTSRRGSTPRCARSWQRASPPAARSPASTASGSTSSTYMDACSPPSRSARCARCASVFDPERRANPGKVVPVHSCREWHGAPSAARRRRRVSDRPRSADSVGARSRDARCASARRDADAASHRRRAARGSTPAARSRRDRASRSTRSRGIVEYEPGDLTLTARAGTTLAEIARRPRAHGQWLALDPFGSERRHDRRDGRDGVRRPARARLRHAARHRARLRGRDRHRRRSCAAADAW